MARYKKTWTATCIFTFYIWFSNAQEPTKTLNLEIAYGWAISHYPTSKDASLIDNIERINLEKIGRESLPSLNLVGQGQLQSENVNIGSPGTAFFVDAPLESFNSYLDLNYNIYDGGGTKARKNIERANAEVERSGLDVQLYALKDRVNALFFAISLAQKNIEIVDLSIEDIDVRINDFKVNLENGTILESELSLLLVKRLELDSQKAMLQGDLSSLISQLEQLVGRELDANVILEFPTFSDQIGLGEIERPEQEFYAQQKELLEVQEKLVSSKTKPTISLFAQGGLGYPNPLNFTDISTSTYAIGGVRLNWKFLDWGSGKKEKQVLRLRQDQASVDEETFLFETDTKRTELINDIKTIEVQILNDEQIVGLQQDILSQYNVQLQNGVINSSEYITQLNAALVARQQLELNKTKLIQAKVELLTLLGKS